MDANQLAAANARAADRDRYVQGMANWKATAEAKDAQIAAANAEREELKRLLEHACVWIGKMPHGDNCYVSNRFDGDPGNQCHCSKESLLDAIDAAIAAREKP